MTSFASCGCPVENDTVRHRVACHLIYARVQATRATYDRYDDECHIDGYDACRSMPSEALHEELTPNIMTIDPDALEKIGRDLLLALGEDPLREGLKDTPKRFARMWAEFMDYDPGRTDTAFSSVQTDQMVVVGPMRVWSKCEHHLVDFWADVTVGYIAHGRVLGLSKFARIAHKHAHRLQIQERLVADIATELIPACGTSDVAVFARGEHLCMTARGIRTPAGMYSSSLHGAFKTNSDTRREFLSLATGDHSR